MNSDLVSVRGGGECADAARVPDRSALSDQVGENGSGLHQGAAASAKRHVPSHLLYMHRDVGTRREKGMDRG